MPEGEAKLRVSTEGTAESAAGLKDVAAAQDGLTKEGVKSAEQAGKRVGVEGLIDGRSAPNPTDGDGNGGTVNRSPEAVEHFYSVYHAPNKLSIRLCHELTRMEERAASFSLRGCSARASSPRLTTRKWLDRHDDISLSFLMREGKDRWCRRYMPHLETDFASIEPAEMAVTDHHECDFWITIGAGEQARQIRPWLTAVLDLRSRCVISWHLGASPHQDAILAAYRMAFSQWAIPTTLKIDNGKDFASKLLTGVTK